MTTTQIAQPIIWPSLPHRLHHAIDPWVITQPDAPCVQDERHALSYREFDIASKKAARRLSDLGVRAGDRVLLVAENCVALAVLFFAASRLDAWACVINARLSKPELDSIRQHAGARLVCYAGETAPTLAHARADLAQQGGFEHIGAVAVSAVDETVHAEPAHAEAHQQVAALIYTSGTSGTPKGVMLTHHNLLFVGDTQRRNRTLTPKDRAYVVLPLTHVYGLASVLIGTLCSGGSLLLAARFDPAEVVRAWRDDGITVMHGVSAMYAKLLEWSRETGQALPVQGLRIAQSGGGGLSQSLKADFEHTTGLTLHLGYGMTEAAPTVAQTLLHAPRTDTSSGVAIPGVEILRVDKHEQPLPPGEVGEVWVRGPNVMKGYYRDPEQTAATLRPDGWLRTGDLGVQDDQGNLTIVGRAKELIIRSGFNVYPAEVEGALNAHPLVLQSAVVGREVQDNEEIVAFIEPVAGAMLTPDVLIAWVRERLSAYKVPSVVVIMPALPAGATGKILKSVLKQQATHV